MSARTIHIHSTNPENRKVDQVCMVLEEGLLITYPTDSLPALGCDPQQKKAVLKMCRVKGIDPQKAHLTFLCGNISQVSMLTKQLDKEVFKVLKRNFPGPITFILPAGKQTIHYFRNKKRTIGVRVPAHRILQAVIASFGRPILSTTVTLNQEEEFRQMWQLSSSLQHDVALLIDDGQEFSGPSTVVELIDQDFEIIRQGIHSFIP